MVIADEEVITGLLQVGPSKGEAHEQFPEPFTPSSHVPPLHVDPPEIPESDRSAPNNEEDRRNAYLDTQDNSDRSTLEDTNNPF